MVRDLSQFIAYAPFPVVGPLTASLPLMAAGAIALLTVAVNFVVDWMLHRASGLKVDAMSTTEPLVKISNLEIDGIADETHTIINNVSPGARGEVMGLIGNRVPANPLGLPPELRP